MEPTSYRLTATTCCDEHLEVNGARLSDRATADASRGTCRRMWSPPEPPARGDARLRDFLRPRAEPCSSWPCSAAGAWFASQAVHSSQHRIAHSGAAQNREGGQHLDQVDTEDTRPPAYCRARLPTLTFVCSCASPARSLWRADFVNATSSGAHFRL